MDWIDTNPFLLLPKRSLAPPTHDKLLCKLKGRERSCYMVSSQAILSLAMKAKNKDKPFHSIPFFL